MEKTELLYKVLVVGDVDVGKTSFVKRYSKEKWAPNTKPTIGVDFVLKELTDIAKNTLVRVQLWDVAGQERFKNLTRVYYKEAVAAVVMFDVTQHSTLKGVEEWKKDIDEKVVMPDGRSIPCILLANKSDLGDHIVDTDELLAFSKKHKFMNHFFTSAKSGKNVNESMDWLMRHIYDTTQAAAKAKKGLKPAQEATPASGKTIELDTTGRLRTFKIVVIGTTGAGSTSIIKRFSNNTFAARTVTTTTLDLSTKTLLLENNARVNVQLWDVPPMKGKGPNAHYKDANGAILVFDSTHQKTLQTVKKMKEELDKVVPGLPCILMSNKTDLPESVLLETSEVEAICAEHKFFSFHDTSALTPQNISEPIIALAQHIYKTEPKAGVAVPEKKKSGCC